MYYFFCAFLLSSLVWWVLYIVISLTEDVSKENRFSQPSLLMKYRPYISVQHKSEPRFKSVRL